MQTLNYFKHNWKDEKVKISPSFVIIGGGITGCSLAYWLSKKNNKNILIIDSDLNYSASIKNAGFLTSGSANFCQKLIKNNQSHIWNISQKNISEINSFIKEHKIEKSIQYQNEGSFSLINQNQLNEFNLNELNNHGFILQAHTISKLNDYFSFFNSNESSFNPDLFIYEFQKILAKNKNIHFHKMNCLDLKKENESWIIKTDLGEIVTEQVLVATNSSKLISNKIDIKRVRAQIASFNLQCHPLSLSNYYLADKRIYFRQLNNQLFIGGLRPLDEITENTDIQGLNPLIQNELKNFVTNNIDKKATLINKWSGIMGITNDELPKYFSNNGLTFLGGYSGHGNGFSFYLSKLVIENLLNKNINSDLKYFKF